MEITTESDSEAATWKEIEVSESYLVCSLYEEAASLASSILKRLRDDYDAAATQDMLESTAMVLVQALKELASCRTPEILNQLRLYFISVKAIPVQVLLTGACFQIAEGSASGVQEFLEEFLNGWSLEDAHYGAVIAEANVEHESRYERHLILGIDEYLEVVEVYAITLLATVLKDVDLAISWVENAPLPDENRQGLLRRLHSMHSLKSTILSQISSPQSPTNNNEASSLKELNACEGSPKALKGKHADNIKYRSKGVSKLSERIDTCFWCFRAINLKFGTAKFVIPSGKIMLGCLILFICYVLRKKQATLKRIVSRQAIALKRALVDFWKLAFSYEVNPLAAVQPLAAATRQGNERLCGAPLGACSSKKKSTVSVIVVVVLVIVALIVIGAVILLFLRRRRKQGAEASRENGPSNSNLQKNGRGPSEWSEEGSHRSSRSQTSSNFKKGDMRLSFVRDDREQFDLQELLRASAEILGSGCFSSSYKAALLNGPTMVVKRFKQMNNVGSEEFQEHMRRLGRLNHPNLLPLVAFYYRKEEKLLVTDFVQNCSLAVRLHGYQALGQPSLDWPTRLKIVKGIAKGLEYLYKEMPGLIAPHGHLKSSNVLLSESLEPILNDYGLVPVINQDLAPDIMVIYKSPEYLQHGRITKKTDVWSFGIMTLEILTGKFPANFLQQGKGSELSIANWVDSVVPEEWSSEVFDKDMMGATRNSEGEMTKLLKIALSCCEADVEKRWDLKEAVDKIQEIKERDHDEDFYSSYASEADMKSSKALSDEVSFNINGEA